MKFSEFYLVFTILVKFGVYFLGLLNFLQYIKHL